MKCKRKKRIIQKKKKKEDYNWRRLRLSVGWLCFLILNVCFCFPFLGRVPCSFLLYIKWHTGRYLLMETFVYSGVPIPTQGVGYREYIITYLYWWSVQKFQRYLNSRVVKKNRRVVLELKKNLEKIPAAARKDFEKNSEKFLSCKKFPKNS